MMDRYNRKLNYLRISITDRCNLNCIYCTPWNFISKLHHNDILSYEEILRIVRIGRNLGISKVRVTGGEPLVRKNVNHFLKQLTAIDGLQDISLTTNGIYLKENLDSIIAARINRLNISLDSLNPEKYCKITGHDLFFKVWEGIQDAEKKGINPIKINVVVLKGYNDLELADFAKLTFTKPYHIRFIEYMPMGKAKLEGIKNLYAPEIKKELEKLGRLEKVEKSANDGPADRYKFQGALGEIGFIKAMSGHFCNTCNRLRLTAGGYIKTCLLSGPDSNIPDIDIKGPLRSGASDDDLTNIFLEAIRCKPKGHKLTIDNQKSALGQMSSIGG